MLVEVTVTQADIDAGVRYGVRQCPVALAIQRATGEPDWWVGHSYIGKGGTGEDNIRGEQPPAMFRWRADFDAGRPVSPATFAVTVSAEGPSD